MNQTPLPHNHHENDEHLVETLPSRTDIESISDAMKQLGDPSRLQIFWLLCHCEQCVINIAAMVGMTSPAVSHHLKLLKSSGLITSRRVGKEMYYKASDTDLVQALHHSIETIAKIKCPQ